MNRSYSKIRHIQESNLRLEERLLKENEAPERYVLDFETGKMVGTHKYGVGFVVNKIGERMGYESHPTSIPNGTKMEKSDDELGMDIDDSSSYDLDNIDDDNQTSEYTSYGKPSKYDPQYSQDPRERYDHGGSQPGH